MRLATWNVNSVRSRIDRVEAFLQRHGRRARPPGDQGPRRPGADDGAGGPRLRGGDVRPQPVERRRDRLPGRPRGRPARLRGDARFGDPLVAEARAIGATCGGVRLWSLYVPNGRAVADPHYDYKLAWLRRSATARGWPVDEPERPVVLAGDWNIAPQDEDVCDIAEFAKSTHVTPPSGRPSRPSWRTGSRTSSARTRPDRASTPTGTTTGSGSSGTGGCGSTSCSAPPSPARHRRVHRPGRARRQGRQRPRTGRRRPRGLSPRRRRRGTTRTAPVLTHVTTHRSLRGFVGGARHPGDMDLTTLSLLSCCSWGCSSGPSRHTARPGRRDPDAPAERLALQQVEGRAAKRP